MATDIRLSVEFWDHPKTIKLERRLGLEAVACLQKLWMWAAKNRPDGRLSEMDSEDVEIAAKWGGETGVLAKWLISLRWIDETDDVLALHDWAEHQDSIRLTRSAAGLVARYHSGIGSSAWRRIRQEVFSRDKNICHYCGSFTQSPDCDHVIPLSRGGTSDIGNLVTACASCNRSK